MSQKNQPVILFGALNGSGKTTLLEGIQIALYGQSAQIGFKWNSYLKYLKSLINKNANQSEGAYIEIEFSANIDSKDETFIINRSWFEKNNKIIEQSTLSNQNIFNGTKKDNVTQFIEILCLQAFQTYFFDGEKIETLALPETSKHIIQDGIYSLLGIHTINELIKSLKVLKKKIDKQKNWGK